MTRSSLNVKFQAEIVLATTTGGDGTSFLELMLLVDELKDWRRNVVDDGRVLCWVTCANFSLI